MIVQPKISVIEGCSGVTYPTAIAIGASPPHHSTSDVWGNMAVACSLAVAGHPSPRPGINIFPAPYAQVTVKVERQDVPSHSYTSYRQGVPCGKQS
jgi:hypothetical protein